MVAFSHNVLDLQYLSSLERTAKKKRLMKEVKFEAWTVIGEVSYPNAGQHPNFEVTEGK